MKRMSQAVLLLLIFLCFSLSAFASKQETGFLNRTINVGGTTYKYQVYVPAEWSKKQKWPVVLFLHGAGERGADGMIQAEVGLGGAIRRHVERFPAVVVFPQCPPDVWWDKGEQVAMDALNAAIKEFHGDRERIYLTGLSMGGYGTWLFAAHHPNTFAALAPVCGGVLEPRSPQRGQSREPYAKAAAAVGKTPVWIFHGNADPAVPVDESRIMYDELKKAGGNVRYYEYEKTGHDSWNKAYAEAEFPVWLFSKRLSDVGKTATEPEMKLVPEN